MWALRTCGQVCVNISNPPSVMAGQWIIAMAMLNGARMVMFAGELFQEKQGDWRLFRVLPPLPFLRVLRSGLRSDPGVSVRSCFLHLLQGTLTGERLAPHGRSVDRTDPHQEPLCCQFKFRCRKAARTESSATTWVTFFKNGTFWMLWRRMLLNPHSPCVGADVPSCLLKSAQSRKQQAAGSSWFTWVTAVRVNKR